MKKGILAFTLVSLAGSGIVFAQPEYGYYFPEGSGPYASIEAGPTFYQNGQLKNFGGPASGSVRYDVGAMTDANIGYAFNQYIAAGFEFGAAGTTINSIPNYYLSDANLYTIPFMGNVTFSYPIPHTIITPYIGVGAGGADAVFDPDTMRNEITGDFVTGSEDDVVFAWEGHAGVRFDIARNVSLGIGYKYLGTGDPNFSYPPSPNLNVRFRGVETHSVMASLTVSFW